MLTIGQLIPDFELKNQSNDSMTCSSFIGKWVVVYFYPKDNTPGCTREAVAFSTLSQSFKEKNAIVLGISKDSVESHRKFCDTHHLDIHLLSDPDKTVINAFGVWQEKTLYGKKSFGIVRSTFIIDPHGCLFHQWVGVKVDGHAQIVLDTLPTC